jgi:farnesyl diphosphate synthase
MSISDLTVSKSEIDIFADKINNYLKDLISNSNSLLNESILYSLIYTGGKRIRPFILSEFANFFKVPESVYMRVAAAIEIIHCYSLIHDDLPAIDNDDYRRGYLSNHKKFSESTAILSGDSLLTYAFEILSDNSFECDDKTKLSIVNLIAKLSGKNGMIAGQYIDINITNPTLDEVINIQKLKTGCLFSASVEGAVILGGKKELLNDLKIFAEKFGLAFQIYDDIQDYDHDNENKSINIISFLGFDSAKTMLNRLLDECHLILNKNNLNINQIKSIINQMYLI